ncbi:metal ABC transporter solute-binding protein, Zn/Mn family [Allochromatium vinosum]|uniref:metal ABC transporter solute-binding protein, Zn/Mn family n=1 Tax=Allochromatium vinosum TaxID=1049 RepID=UPI001905A696|nr:zinc ABC transporter substrate-binding protein [Allochromatium vinosum]MBK1654160.1 ABC transporter substrate-binding protein [Allochromatium vinosum]
MQTRILSFIALLCLSTALPGADRIQVFVTVLPQQTFVEQVGGPHVQVEALVGAGSNPHAYEPTPGQIARLAEADVYFGIGLPVEAAWMKRIRAVNPEIRVVDLSDGISRRRLEAHEHEHGHGAEPDHHHESDSEQDPHIWTSPPLVIGMAERIAGTLSEFDPERAAEYEARRADFIAELKALDADTRARLDRLTHRRFMVYHPSWGYFAETYGLTQIPIEAEGKEPGPRRLAALIDQARREDVRVILAQPQLSTKAAEQVAREIGGRVEVVDTLAADYIGTIRHLTRVLTSADE